MRAAQIKFSTKSFGIEAAEVAARAIENVAGSLTHVDISDVIAGRPEKEVLGALQLMSQSLSKAKLKALDLSDNALGQKGIIACAQAFAQQVTNLSKDHRMSGNFAQNTHCAQGLHEDCASQVSELLCTMLRFCKGLDCLLCLAYMILPLHDPHTRYTVCDCI